MTSTASRSTSRRWSIGFVALAIAAVGPLTTDLDSTGPPRSAALAAMAVGPAPAGSSAFRPVAPCRLIDTRELAGPVPAGTAVAVPVRGRCGVSPTATAVAVTLTADRPAGPGFLTLWDGVGPAPLASNLNVAAGEIRANAAIVPVSDAGSIAVFTSTATDLVVDVSGSFEPAPVTGVSSGRFVPLAPMRLVDTRETGVRLAAGGSLTIPRPPLVPADSLALAVTVTVTGSIGPGFVTAFASGSATSPPTSVVNTDGIGQTRAAGLIVPMSPTGITITSSSAVDAVVDIAGYFTGPSAAASPEGLYVAASPTRVLDTRSGDPAAADSTLPISIGDGGYGAGRAGSAIAVGGNWTIVEPVGPGYVTASAAEVTRPPTSTVNSDVAGGIVADFAIVPVSTSGLAAFASVTTDLVVDVTGWFHGSPIVPGSISVAAVGDLVCGATEPVVAGSCHQQRVSDLIVADPAITAFLALGDLQYPAGSAADFASMYAASYGRVRAITSPTVGNHEYGTAAAGGYFGYFGDLARSDPAGAPPGVYSRDLGENWHLVSLNSNCSIVSCASGSAQERWLRADLAANDRPCVIAIWHHPRFSSGAAHGDDNTVAPLYAALDDHRVDLLLTGHDHLYERFAPQRSNALGALDGVRQFVVGTGGRNLTSFGPAHANSQVRIAGAFGLLRLTLEPTSYRWSFVTEDGVVADSGSAGCH